MNVILIIKLIYIYIKDNQTYVAGQDIEKEIECSFNPNKSSKFAGSPGKIHP
jgi:hypothetical protein